MKKQKIKFKDVTITLNKKELKLLTFMIGNLAGSDSEVLVGDMMVSYDLYEVLNREMKAQNVKDIPKRIEFEITD